MTNQPFVYAKMLCPMCGQMMDTEITVEIGDRRLMHCYTIGDRVVWRRNASVQDGGRPGNGSIDAKGFTSSSNCGHTWFVNVIIRGDIIRDVVVDLEMMEIEAYMQVDPQQAARAIQIPPARGVPQQGKVAIDFSAEWLTDERKKLIEQLVERGVIIYAPYPGAMDDDYRMMIPLGLHPVIYIEIAFIMAQLADEHFPEPIIEYVESYPNGVKYRKKIPLVNSPAETKNNLDEAS